MGKREGRRRKEENRVSGIGLQVSMQNIQEWNLVPGMTWGHNYVSHLVIPEEGVAPAVILCVWRAGQHFIRNPWHCPQLSSGDPSKPAGRVS